MKIREIVWLDDVVDKLHWKHHVTTTEVEEVLSRKPIIGFKEKGRHNSEENLYAALGSTEAGRYLLVLFILKSNQRALIITARDMTISEKRYYEKNKS